ncbi:MAG TPA: hypothetical protein VN677_08680 [Gemmatimonadaceae bacterium]|nr:hypothetical protein [Gemmatimonadaceae bacterium]
MTEHSTAEAERPAVPNAMTGSAGARHRAAGTAVALATVVNIAVAVLAHHFPYGDVMNHLARYVLMERFWFGAPPPGIVVHLTPTAYIGVDLVGVALVHLFGPHAALRILTAIALALLPAGMYALISVTAPPRREWALVGALLGFNWFLIQGMINYAIGVGIVLFWFAWWWPRRAVPSWPVRILLSIAAVGLLLIHLTTPLIALVVIWVDYALGLLPQGELPTNLRHRLFRSELVTCVTITAVVGVAWGVVLTSPGGANLVESFEFRGASMKLLELGAPFFSFSLLQAGIMAALYGICLMAFLYINRARLRLDTFTASAIVFLVLFLVFPQGSKVGGAMDIRWLLPAWLLPFCMTAREPSDAPRPWLRQALLAACVLNALVIWHYTRSADRLLADFDVALEHVPPDTRLLAIISDHQPHPRVDPYAQYAFWHIIRNRGQVAGLWSYTGARDGDALLSYFRHFVVLHHLYLPAARWGTADFSPLDWQRVNHDYDYIIQAGTDERVDAILSAHATPSFRDGAMTVYKVSGSR